MFSHFEETPTLQAKMIVSRNTVLLLSTLAGVARGFTPVARFNTNIHTNKFNDGIFSIRSSSLSSSSSSSDEIEKCIERGNINTALSILGDPETTSISPKLGAKLLNACASLENELSNDDTESLYPAGMVSPMQERNLVECYTLLKEKCVNNNSNENNNSGLYGSVSMNDLPLPYTMGCTIEKLETETELPLSAFRPNPNIGRLYGIGGALAVVVQVLISQALHMSTEPLFLATFAAVAADQLISGGGVGEKVLLTLFPSMKDRILRHEAGHLLVAHLLGCPVQSLALGKWDAISKQLQSGVQSGLVGAGTSFFDPELNKASMKGRVTRSIIDRYSVILMAGIAAEAMNFGESEGGSDDEQSLAAFLSQTVQSNLNIPEQARWAATNAILLLKKNRDAYDRLIKVLQNKGSGDIGQIMMALEGYDI